jgi:hypothetical protein
MSTGSVKEEHFSATGDLSLMMSDRGELSV